MCGKGMLSPLVVTVVLGILAISAAAQSLTSGDVTGTVSDPSGAVVGNATVTLKNNQTGSTQSHAADAQGVYRFSLLAPGSYTVSASSTGFETVTQTTNVTVGQTTQANIQLAISGSATTVEVQDVGGVVQAENGDVSTSFSEQQVGRPGIVQIQERIVFVHAVDCEKVRRRWQPIG